MKLVRRYIADDGSEHRTAARATIRDCLIRAVERAIKPIGALYRNEANCNYQNGKGYIRHAPEAVMETKRNLIALTREYLAEWMTNQETIHHVDLMKVDPSWFLRMLDGGSEAPLQEAWGRLLSIDAEGREWGQPHYAEHPEEGQEFEIERPGDDRP